LHLISFRLARTRACEGPMQAGDREAELVMGYAVGAAAWGLEAGEALPVSSEGFIREAVVRL
jgi:hypothetical protein